MIELLIVAVIAFAGGFVIASTLSRRYIAAYILRLNAATAALEAAAQASMDGDTEAADTLYEEADAALYSLLVDYRRQSE